MEAFIEEKQRKIMLKTREKKGKALEEGEERNRGEEIEENIRGRFYSLPSWKKKKLSLIINFKADAILFLGRFFRTDGLLWPIKLYSCNQKKLT